MIHDATVEVACDGKNCLESVFIRLHYIYRTMSESSGYYDSSDGTIEASVVDDHEWIVRDGKHYCSQECAG